MSQQEIGVGIDLGTSNSSICRLDTSRGIYDFAHVRGESGRTELPSLVTAFRGELYFGDAAIRRERAEGSDSLRNFKLLLRGNETVVLGGVEYSPVDLMHKFLVYLKQTYETQWGPLGKAVITVPANEEFDMDYRERVRQSVQGPDGDSPLLADVVTMHEPDAVLMSLIELDKLSGQRLLVFDMGGGTLDVTIREVHDNPANSLRPLLKSLSIMGSAAAGVAVTRDYGIWALKQWASKQKTTFTDQQIGQLVTLNFGSLDSSKIALSGMGDREGVNPTMTDTLSLNGGDVGRTIQIDVQVSELTELCRAVCDEALALVKRAVADAGLVATDIDKYILVGGSSQLPLVKHLLREYFGKEPLSHVGELGRIDPFNAISKGAAVHDLDREPELATKSGEVSGPQKVPNTAPILEQKLPYDISLLVNEGKSLKVLVPKGVVLPYEEAATTFYMPSTDDNIDIALFRGGDLAAAKPVARRRVVFPKTLDVDTAVEVLISVAEDGAVTVFAVGDDGEAIPALVADRLDN